MSKSISKYLNWSVLILSKIWSGPGKTSKSTPGGEQVSPSFRQVMNEITQGNEGNKCTDNLVSLAWLDYQCFVT